VAEINPIALGHELAILVGLAVQSALLVGMIALIILARRREPGGWVRWCIFILLVLTPVACGWVGYQCLQLHTYVRSKEDDPVAATKLAADRASSRPTALASLGLCVATVAGGWAAVRTRRSVRPLSA